MRRIAGVAMLFLTGGGLFGSLSTASCSSGNEVRSVYTAIDGNGSRRRTQFYTDTDVIYCDVDYVGDRKDITVNAVLRQLTGEACPAVFYPNPASCPGGNALQTSWNKGTAPLNNVVSVLELAPGPGVQTLAFDWQPKSNGSSDAGSSSSGASPPPPPWPVGKYRCEVNVDGVLQGSAEFEVKWPDGPGQAYKGQGNCPVTPVIPGNPCWDYVLPDTQCLNAFGKVCACKQDTGNWTCP